MTAAAMPSTKVVSHGLDHSLVYHPTTGLLSRRDWQSTLPGQPWATLSSNEKLLAYVQRNHGVSSFQWLQEKVGSFSDYWAIIPLHAYDRTRLTEHPDLHLSKASPVYNGQWPGDYRITPIDEGSGGGYRITYEGFVEFIAQFARARVPDAAVAPRYRFGVLENGYPTSDLPRKLFSEPSEQQEEEHKRNTSSTSISKDDAKNIGEVAPASDFPGVFYLGGAFVLGLGFPVFWWWNEAHWAVQLFLLGPLGVLAAFLLLFMLFGLSVWACEVANSKDKTVPGKKEEEKEKEAEKGKENETETEEKELLIEGLDTV
ncbi:hypothetical protein PG988_015790 [Apiospora saccharicola]